MNGKAAGGPSLDVFPLSHGQRALWFLHQLAPVEAYLEARVFRFRSAVDVPALQAGVLVLIDRHASLRTTYATHDGQPVQIVHPRGQPAFTVTDASAWSPDEFRERLTAEVHRPFDLGRGPLLRLHLFQKGEEHFLLLSLHHIAMDFWSIDRLLAEFQALSEGKQLPPSSCRYRDFVAWQERMLAGPEGERLWAYWRKQLGGELAVLDLPTDRPRPSLQTYAGLCHPFRLDEDLSSRLKTLARSEQATLFMTLLAAFQVLLYRYTGQADLLVGSVTAGRRPEFAGLFGLLSNPVALRADLSGNPTFRAFLAQVRGTVLDALEHEDFPYSLLVERLLAGRDPSRPPLCTVSFILQKPHRVPTRDGSGEPSYPATLPMGGDQWELYPLECRVARLDLELEMFEADGALAGWVQYNTDLFDAATIARLADHFQTLLAGIVADPDCRLADLPLQSEPAGLSRRPTPRDQPAGSQVPDDCVHELFQRQAARTPAAVAVTFEGRQLTYQELNERSNQLAHYLRCQGVGPEVLVGICVERSPDLVVALLAVLKAGGAYVPLDPACPRERLAFLLEDAQVRALLTVANLATAEPPSTRAAVVYLDTGWDRISWERTENPVSGVRPGNLAYAIYTSGSTGTPRGVLVEHRGVCNLARSQVEAFDVRPDSRVLQFAPFSFDASVSEVFMALGAGATLCLAPRDRLLPGPDLLQLLRDQAITHVTLPPSVLAVLPSADLPDLRVVVAAGEACPANVVRRWAPGRRFFNAYGPTEATVCATIAECVAGEGKPSLGRPIAGIAAYVLDSHLHPVPVGVPGELYLAGVGLARGYLNRPELTGERFVPNPVAASGLTYRLGVGLTSEAACGHGGPGERLYKTGDRVRLLPDGSLDFLGRLDGQVKVRGCRVELGEVEAVLGGQPAVREVAVVAQEHRDGEKRLLAYVVLRQPVAQGALRDFLKERLPEYMIPSAFVLLDTLPLTANGKVDRRALRSRIEDRGSRIEDRGSLFSRSSILDPRSSILAPRDELELRVLRVWEEVLDRRPLGVRDDFFDLGGHSLLAVRLLTRLEEEFGDRLPLATLFQAPTVERLAALLRSRPRALVSPQVTAGLAPLVAIQPGGSRRPFFCVHPVGGSAFCYVELARCLGRDQPVYGLQARGLDGAETPHATIEAMAADYVEALRSVQPEGPYRLGGWSMGGAVAFEMARQLAQLGQRTDLLALLDTQAPLGAGAVPEIDEAQLLVNFAMDLGFAADNASISWEGLLQVAPDERLARLLEQAREAGAVLPDLGLPQLRHWLQVFKVNVQATLAYRPVPLRQRLALYRPRETLAVNLGDPAAWGQFATALDVQILPGSHYTMLREPHVRNLAEGLRVYLS